MPRGGGSGKETKRWRAAHGFGNDFMNHVPETRFAEIEQGLTQGQIRSLMGEGDNVANPSFLINAVRDSKSLGLSDDATGLRSYNKIPSDSMISVDGYYRLCEEDNDQFTIGLRIHYLRDRYDRAYRYNIAFIPQESQTIFFERKDHYYKLTIDGIIIPVPYKGGTCKVTGRLVEVDAENVINSDRLKGQANEGR